MESERIAEIIWAVVNSPAGIAVIAGFFAWVLNAIYAKKPLWQQWEGTIISAVKLAEKAIPDDTDNKAAARADEAMRLILRAYEQAKGRPAKLAEVISLQDGMALVHASLEAAGMLRAEKVEPELEGK